MRSLTGVGGSGPRRSVRWSQALVKQGCDGICSTRESSGQDLMHKTIDCS